jgi:pectin lyase
MKGHAFDAYTGAQALVEGNVFSGVSQPVTDKGASIGTFVVNAGSACSSALGRSCLANSVDSASGKLTGGSSTFFIKGITNDVSPLDVAKVAAHVKANAGPANLGSAASGATEKNVETPTTTKAAATSKAATATAPARTTLATVKKPAATQGAALGGVAVAAWGQCGGQGYTGSTTCAGGLTCKKQNAWYSQCL